VAERQHHDERDRAAGDDLTRLRHPMTQRRSGCQGEEAAAGHLHGDPQGRAAAGAQRQRGQRDDADRQHGHGRGRPRHGACTERRGGGVSGFGGGLVEQVRDRCGEGGDA